jgi:hypothetical protein
VKIGDYEVEPPITPYNRGFLEGATWRASTMSKESEALKRRARILELKLIVARAEHALDGNLSDQESRSACARLVDAKTALDLLKLTPEEKAL